MDNNNKKFSRGKNYTAEDRSVLLSIVESKKDIIECKQTNKVSWEAKKEVWLDVAKTFNSLSSVPRTATQLKIFYENIKRKIKKDVALENKDRYKDILNNEEFGEVDELEKLKELKQRARQEKGEILKTGGGNFSSSLTEDDHRLIALLGENIRPLDNPFDDANSYFAQPIPIILAADDTMSLEDAVPSNSENTNSYPIITNHEENPCTSCATVQKKPKKRLSNSDKKQPKKFRYFTSPKDRYYMQKLANAKIENKILRLRLKKEMKSNI